MIGANAPGIDTNTPPAVASAAYAANVGMRENLIPREAKVTRSRNFLQFISSQL